MTITDASYGVVVDGESLTVTVDHSARDALTVRVYSPGGLRVHGTPDDVLAALDEPALDATRFILDRVVEAMQLAVAMGAEE